MDVVGQPAPYLHMATVCNSHRLGTGGAGLPATIEPLDEGQFDDFAVLGALRAVGYAAPVGGDAYTTLRRSLKLWCPMTCSGRA